MAGWIVAVAALAVALWGVWIYNRLVALRNRAREGWSGVDVQLKRRTDLVPALVESVRGAMGHERALFVRITEARGAALAADAGMVGAARAAAESDLSAGLMRLRLAVEAYPALRANENAMALQAALSDTEEQIQMSRRYYNGAVRELNSAVEQVPGNLVARFGGIAPLPFFGLDAEAERNAPVVALTETA